MLPTSARVRSHAGSDRIGLPNNMRICLDSCALNRLTDSPRHLRIHQEAEAVEHILELIRAGSLEWIASSVLRWELGRNPDPINRGVALRLLQSAQHMQAPGPMTMRRARYFKSCGFGALDALHLALAEEAKVDRFLTVDDRFFRLIQRRLGNPAVIAVNPLTWWQGGCR